MSYLMVKHLHMTFVFTTICLFSLRLYWSVTGSHYLQQKWLKVVPHVIDTLLLSCAIYLLTLLKLWPLEHPWILAKLVALVAYILLGSVALKRGKTARIRMKAGLSAILVFTYMLLVAFSRSPCIGLMDC